VHSDEKLTAFVEVQFAVQQIYNREVVLCCSHPKKRELPKSDFWHPELLKHTHLFSLYANAVLSWSIEGTIYLQKCNSWINPTIENPHGRTQGIRVREGWRRNYSEAARQFFSLPGLLLRGV
jgi:hypothetical protein